MNIVELINRVGMENVRVQFLPHDMLNVNKRRRDAKITFGTSLDCADGLMANIVKNGSGMIAAVVWMPAEKALSERITP